MPLREQKFIQPDFAWHLIGTLEVSAIADTKNLVLVRAQQRNKEAMQFTPGQVKEALGLGEETLRYWRRVLPGFSGRRGYAPCFGFHEVVCLRFVKEICTVLGLQVSKIVPVVPDLQRFIAQSIFSDKEVWFLSFDPVTETLAKVTATELSTVARTVVIIPANAIIVEVRSKLLGLEEIEQPPLPFPLVGIAGTRHE